MPTIHLGRRALANLPTVDKTTVYYDHSLKGFGLKVTPAGAKSWCIEYRPGAGGRGVAKRRMVIGSPEKLSPEDARAKARGLLARVELGEDPAGERTEARRGCAVSDLLEFYMAELIRPKRKPKTLQLFELLIRRHIEPALGGRKANTLTRSDVTRLHAAIGKDYPVTANRVLTLLCAAYAYATKAGIVPEGFGNPARSIERFTERSRERYLTVDEMNRLGATLRLAETDGLPWEPDFRKKVKHAPKGENRRVVVDPLAVAALRLLLFTGARLREILHLKWQYVDLERGLLRLPDSKTGQKTIVVGEPARVVLAAIPRIGDYCFPAHPRRGTEGGMKRGEQRPRADLHRPWARIAAHAGLEGVRIHDLRHSFASVAMGSGMGLPIIGKMLGHLDSATTARYAHLADDPWRRASNITSSTIAAALENGFADKATPTKDAAARSICG
jgi:integrase